MTLSNGKGASKRPEFIGSPAEVGPLVLFYITDEFIIVINVRKIFISVTLNMHCYLLMFVKV